MQPRFGKIIDVSGSTSELTVAQVDRIAKMLRGNADEKRGLVAFVDRVGFAHAFADATKTDRPVKLFRSLHDAHAWLLDEAVNGPVPKPPRGLRPWPDDGVFQVGSTTPKSLAPLIPSNMNCTARAANITPASRAMTFPPVVRRSLCRTSVAIMPT